MNIWYLVTVKYTKECKDGTLKRVSEPYLINALSHADAEGRVYKEVGEFIRGEFLVTGVKPYNVADIFDYQDSDNWFKITVSYVTEDADSGKEKRVNNHFLLNAPLAIDALYRIDQSLQGLMVSFEVTNLAKTKIIDIYPYEAPAEDEEE